MKKNILLVSSVCILSTLLFYSIKLWFKMDFVDISFNGMLAILICIFVSLLLGISLMTLVFFSSKIGYDDQVDHDLEKIFEKYKKL